MLNSFSVTIFLKCLRKREVELKYLLGHMLSGKVMMGEQAWQKLCGRLWTVGGTGQKVY
jgi:hypothetical protein